MVMAFLICALFYEKGQIVRQEADTNNDRRVDVWVKFENNERVEQLEDQNFRGKISARYVFKAGQDRGAGASRRCRAAIRCFSLCCG